MKRFIIPAAAMLAAGAAHAQPNESAPPTAATPPAAPASTGDTVDSTETVIVTAQRLPGSVQTDVPPEIVLNPQEIRGYGASSIAELLASLAPQTGSARGRGGGMPAVLLNGRRVSGFQEIRTLPPEAIMRVETFNEDVAVQLGFPPDQRVINFILFPRFRVATVEAGFAEFADGDATENDFDASFLRIRDGRRLNLTLEYENTSKVTQSDRGVRLAGPGGIDATRFTTVAPEGEELNLGLNYNRPLGKTTAATIDLRYIGSTSTSLLGLPTLAVPTGTTTTVRAFTGLGPIERERTVSNPRASLTFDGTRGRWQWTLSGVLERNETETVTDGGVDAAPLLASGLNLLGPETGLPVREAAQSRVTGTTDSASVTFNTNGILTQLDAGPLRGSLRLSADATALSTETERAGVRRTSDLDRTELLARGALTVPLTSRRREVLPAFGDTSLTLSGSVSDLSDAGGLVGYGATFAWSPVSDWRFSLDVRRSETAPGLRQLGDAPLVTPNAEVFDPARGETARVTLTSGGNAALRNETADETSLSVNFQPRAHDGLNMSLAYVMDRTDDDILAFPNLTPALAAAFPGRITRDAGGRLIALDSRPINAARTEQDRVRWSINYSRAFGPKIPELRRSMTGVFAASRNAGPGQGPFAGMGGGGFGGGGPGGGPGGGGTGGGPGGGGARPGGGGPPPGVAAMFGGGGGPPRVGRWNVSLTHTILLSDEVQFFDGGPTFDRLDGDVGGDGGGSRTHEVQLEGGVNFLTAGVRLFGTWRSQAELRGATPAQDLIFEPNLTLNLRAFASLPPGIVLTERYPILSRLRFVLRVDNLTDEAPKVRDRSGATPAAYQPGLLAPRGRLVEFSLRKQF